MDCIVHGVAKSSAQLSNFHSMWGFPGGAGGKEPACQFRRHRLDPWVGKISWRWKWQTTPAFLSGKSHGQKSLSIHSKELDMTEVTEHACMIR